jgi:hypothetical protein
MLAPHCNSWWRPMIRISLPYLWGLSAQLELLERLEPKDWDRFELFVEVSEAQSALDTLIRGSVFAQTLRSSRPLAEHVLQMLNAYGDPAKLDMKVTRYEVTQLTRAYSQFKIAFLAELQTFPAFFVTQKGGYDTITLLDQPWRLFPADLAIKVPEAMYDVAEVGKALCYETATACGFHVFRATETVLRRYYSHVTGGQAHPKVRNIMVYVQAMRKANCGDPKVLSAIEQLAKLHRDPIAHPEAALTVDEAISMLGMAHSAITFMLTGLPVPPPTTTAVAASPGPPPTTP